MDDPKPTGEAATREELESSVRFLHVMMMQTRILLADTTARVLALGEQLLEAGLTPLADFEQRRGRLQKELGEAMGREHNVAVNTVPDKYALTDLPRIDCASRIPLCKAACCKLSFPLSFQDLDEGVVRWEYRRPYHIKRGEDGYCTHNCPETRGCQVREVRPAVCRTYDCREDKRIWQDFEQMIPAEDL